MCCSPPNGCCCGSLHIKTAAIVIGWFHIITGLLGIPGSIFQGVRESHLYYIGTAYCLIYVVVGSLAVAGVRRHNPCLLAPAIGLQAIEILCVIAGTVFVITVMALDDKAGKAMDKISHFNLLELSVFCFFLLAIMVSLLGIPLWFLCVLVKCRKYLENLSYVVFDDDPVLRRFNRV
ncbi:hypothetical protein QR680_004085 [Steinernema hermaphroditum]|uniref:Uncharacterized protein n=1 Tax=Steinernema hermaphroditum TaxID=289476 RepID=A0AA39HML5_9BILA|nr:hypothetical protein QR680_004085 [Steinernema hermaphroditum]